MSESTESLAQQQDDGAAVPPGLSAGKDGGGNVGLEERAERALSNGMARDRFQWVNTPESHKHNRRELKRFEGEWEARRKGLGPATTTMATARALAWAAHPKSAQVSAYYLAGGPVPPTTCGPVTDSIEAKKLRDGMIELILDHVPAELFDWTDPPTEESVQRNLSAPGRWAAIKRPKPINSRQHKSTSGDSSLKAETNGTATEAADIPMPRLWSADELKPAKSVEWLAANRIPRAAVCLLVGDEGIGKSLFWILLVAAITTGNAVPELGIPAREPEYVIVVLTEDDWQTVARPRLEVAGADLSMIKVMCSEDDGSGSPVFPRDVALITDSGIRPAILVIDAWLDTVSTNLQVRDSQQARVALHPFKDMATKTGATVMPLVHTNRLDTANARDKYGATAELRKKARMTLYALENEDGRLVVGPEKANLTRLLPATIFGKQSVQYFGPTPDSDGTVPKLFVHAESDMTIREHLADIHAANHDSDNPDALAWLAEYLASGPRWKSHIDSAAEPKRLSPKRLETAKRKLGVKSIQAHDGARSAWFWCLPQHVDQTPKGPA